MRKTFLQLFSVMLLLVSFRAAQAQTTIFDYRSAWKYLDNGSNQGTAWTGTGFNDAGWASDTGWFGYGDPAFVTKCVNACGTVSCAPSCGSKYITTYFRKVVNIPSIAAYDSMILNIIRDDGFVVYVNGVEVWRNNLPTGTITNTTVAQTALGGADEYTPISLTIPASFFVSGNNTIALELHQQAGSSSDLSFNMQMIGVPSPLFFDYRSAWKYLDNGSNQGTAWTGTGFNDASWASDTGWFGYGDAAFVTKCVNACGTLTCSPSCTNKYITTYFRKVAGIPNTALYDSVKMSIIRDDAIAVYVNGTEVWRCPNMPTGTLSFTSQALAAIGNAAETTAVIKTIPISYFINGNNTIAVELHQESGTSSDLNFNMRMEGVRRVYVPPVNLVFGPYLQMGSQTAANLRWRTSIASKSRVMFGTTLGTYPIIVSDGALVNDHDIRVTGLLPNTKYFYRFGTDTSILQGDSTNFFTTAPADTSTRRVTVAVFGDCGQNNVGYQTTTLAAYQSFLAANSMKAADLMLLGGDNAYNNGTDAEFATKFFAPYSSNILKNHMLFPAPGNHDYDNGARFDVGVPYFSLFTTPTAGESGGVPSGTEAYYSYDWGNIHFLSLDSYGKGDANTTRMFDTTGAQVNWIKADLAATNKKWVIAYWHHPPYTMTSHNSDTEPELSSIRQRFIQILERYGVDLIICGHSHAYERSHLMKGHYGTEASFNKAIHTTDSSTAKYDGSTNSCPYNYASGKNNHGTVYVVAGSSGASGGTQGAYPHNALPIAVNDGGMFFLDIQDNRLDAKFVRRNNTIFDQFTIMKDVKKKDTIAVFPGTALYYSASWRGTYAWNTGATTRATTVIAPLTDTMITVKDNTAGTCLTDQHYIDVQCTMPVFTTCPANITTSGCNATVNYAIADTATPNPSLSYTFSGATTGSGAGSGSGSTFNTGVTNVTVTATNTCGSVSCSFNITVNSLPNAVTVTGGGAVCGNTTLMASNGGSGTIYYQGVIPDGTSTALPSTSETITGSGTYYFRARGTDGCWGAETGVAVTVNPLPAPVAVSGAGAFCGSAGITASNGSDGTMYYQATTLAGTSTVTPSAAETVLSSGTYYFRARSSAGCWGTQGSVTVTVNALPAAVTAAGPGTACNEATITASNGGSGTIYFQRVTAGGTSVATASSSLQVTSSGTYYFRAQSAEGCWGTEGSVTVTVNPLPAPVIVFGAGVFCGNTTITAANGSSGTIYFQGTASGGTSLSTPATSVVVASSGTYYFRALSAEGCWGTEGSVTVTVSPMPAVHALTGGGSYCVMGAGVGISLAGSDIGINYQLYHGTTPVGSIMPGTGSLLNFGLQTAAGGYSVVATDPSTMCASNMPGAVSVSINPLPNVYTVTGGGSYCAGGTGVYVGLSASATGIQYQLYNGLSPVGVARTGAGSAIDFGVQTAPGTYTVVATNATTLCRSNMGGNASVAVNPLPVAYNVTGGGSYCAGGTGVHVGLSASNTGIRYQLYSGISSIGVPVTGVGASLDFGLYTAAGSYTVVATNIATNCAANMTGSAAVVINALPVAYNVTGGGSYCSGGTGVRVLLGNSNTGINYQLYNGLTASGSAMAGSGAALDFGLRTTSGTYTVIATNAATLCASNMTGGATIAIKPLPVAYNVTGGGSYCWGASGVHVGLSSSATSVRYQLYRGATLSGSAVTGSGAPIDFGFRTTAGTYTAMATDTITGCVQNMSGSAAVVVTPLVTPALSIQSDKGSTACKGDLVTFAATPVNGGTAPAYRWIVNNINTGVIRDTFRAMPADGDVVEVSMTSNATCVSDIVPVASMVIKVDTALSPVVNIVATPGTNVSSGQKVTFRAIATGIAAGTTYQWYLNGVAVPGATNTLIVADTFAHNDSVSCAVATGNGCGDHLLTPSVKMRVDRVNVNTPGSLMSTVRVLPNPNKGEFTVVGTLGTTGDAAVTLELTNMLGQVIYHDKVVARNGSLNELVRVSSTISGGMYLLSIHSDTENKVFHIVIER